VSALHVFAGLPRDALQAISECCRVRRYGVFEHVMHHHENSSELFFVLDGRARIVLYSRSGRDVSFRDLDPGEVFGELAADGSVTRRPR
jgi:CRP-like cAMP-binding protein